MGDEQERDEQGPHTDDFPAGDKPNAAQRKYLARGLKEPGGKLPLFDEYGQHIHPALVRACIAHGWAEPWFGNPLRPDWLVCKLTEKGRQVVAGGETR